MTDTHKRRNSGDVLRQATSQVVTWLLNLQGQCPSNQAKKKVFECFLSWIKFTTLAPGDIAQNAILADCFREVVTGSDLSEASTDIIIEVLRMSSCNLGAFSPVVQMILQQLPALQQKF